MTYSEKLKDPRWQKKRLEILQRDDFTCTFCGDDSTTLAVHHAIYEKGKEPWEHSDNHLFTLCENCHQWEYEERKTCEQNLVNALRIQKFQFNSVHELASTLESAHFYHIPEIFICALCHAIKTEVLQKYIINEYFKHIEHKVSQDSKK